MRGDWVVSALATGNNASFMRVLEAEAVLGWGGPEDPVSPGKKHAVAHRFSTLSPPHALPSHARSVLEDTVRLQNAGKLYAIETVLIHLYYKCLEIENIGLLNTLYSHS